MATIVLSAVGAAIGSSIGGSVLGLSSVVIGRAVGATVGRLIDQRLLGAGSPAVETGRVDRFRLNGASEGEAIPLVFGRMRVGGHVIWTSRFRERRRSTGGDTGGKGAPARPKITTYSYSVSVALALCEGPIARVGRVWADGVEIARDEIEMRVYTGSDSQLPDPKIEAVEGAGMAPAYRGTAYVVIEDLELGPFGNRVPQFSFEVIRPEPEGLDAVADLSRAIRGVAMMPGTGEYALATTRVHFSDAPGVNRSANVNSPGGRTDLEVSLESLREELPACRAVSLVVSWFGDDLRCGACRVQPKVEQSARDGIGMPWRVSGIGRSSAAVVASVEGRPVYGGTPADRSVVEAIRRMNESGLEVMFYPFLLMEQLDGNGLPDPWSDAPDQPVLPWRGRITLDVAPGRPGSTDGSASAASQVAAFFGTARPADFHVDGSEISYVGTPETSYRRFILHYAHLCKAAGGVEAFCIGSEMRSLTQIRGPGNIFPAVEELRRLAGDVRSILGPTVRIGYAADWSEYFGYHPQDGSADVFFHLDPLWADPAIDFVGIDNYMPVSDWRDGDDHADAGWGSIYNLGYLKANIEGGEGFEWYYHSPEAAEIQLRTPITDGAYGEPWVFRFKDIRSWWSEPHFDRVGGQRSGTQTPWVPESKPIRFTEYGCPAVDRGTNEPNRFFDPKSSESALPHHSSGRRDDLIQMQYLRAIADHWSAAGSNPLSQVYGGPMLDMSHCYAWAWDARPYPFFPAKRDTWSDGENYRLGHWLTGRVTSRSLASVVAEICRRAGLTDFDVSDLHGLVNGFAPTDQGNGRALLQPLMLAFGFDAFESDGKIVFRSREMARPQKLESHDLAVLEGETGEFVLVRGGPSDAPGRLNLTYVEVDGDFEVRSTEASAPDSTVRSIARSELPLALSGREARSIAERWLAEARVGRDRLRFALPQSRLSIGTADVVSLTDNGRYRIDALEDAGARLCEAVRIEPGLYRPADIPDDPPEVRPFVPPLPVEPVFLDLPLLTGEEVPGAPHIAVSGTPWTEAAVYASNSDDDFELLRIVEESATMGETLSALARAQAGIWDRAPPLRVRLYAGSFSSVSPMAVLEGRNAVAIGDPASDAWEVFQFARADLVGPGLYDLSMRLRGQAGTEAIVPDEWPPGSRVVLLDPAVVQIGLPASVLRLERRYRVGPSRRGPGDASYVETTRSFDGIGLRPYAPSQLRARRSADGTFVIMWIRRTRIDGDGWTGQEVPLGETSERYRVRVVFGGSIVRETETPSPNWTYSSADRTSDGLTGSFDVHVAQISESFGPGPFARIEIDG